MNLYLKRLFGTRLRKILFATLVIIVALSTIVYAYFVSVSSPETVGPSVSITSPPLQLSLSLDKAEYQTSDNLTLSFSLRNISNKTVTMIEYRTHSLGLEPNIPTFNLTTSAVGVSTPNAGDLEHHFHFGFKWVSSNGTIDEEPLTGIPELIYVTLEPDGCLNQTLRISLPSFWDSLVSQPSRTGAFQIRASLADFSVERIETAATIETPSIAFTIGQ